MIKYGLLLLAFVVGCAGQDPVSTGVADPTAKMTVSAPAGGRKEVRTRQVRERPRLIFDTPLQAGGLQITWLEVQDSRCPEGAVCIWEGEVMARIQVSEAGEDLGTFALTLNRTDRDKAQITVGGRVIRLLAVEPYPELDVVTPHESYAALLTVDRRGGLVVSDRTAGGYRGRLPSTRPVEPRPDKVDHAALAMTLEENRLKWQANATANYRFNFQRGCFCLRDYTREAVVEVAEGAIVAAAYADDGVAVEADLNDRYDTIDELFALLQQAVVSGAVQIDVEFDPVLGYPTNLYIDQDRRIADEEQWIAASGVVLEP